MFACVGRSGECRGFPGRVRLKARCAAFAGAALACLVLIWVLGVGVAVARWSLQSVPNPNPSAGNVFSGVSCPSSKECLAVGGASELGAEWGPLFADRWNDQVWSEHQLPYPPPNPNTNTLAAVSCPSATACVAVGSQQSGVLVEAWNDRKWSAQRAPNPKGSISTELLSVSCPLTTDCFAVGDWAGQNGFALPLLERWNGSKWTVEPTAEPYGSNNSVTFTGVSCTSATACTAVGGGSRPPAGDAQFMVVERWNGHRWSVQRPEPPPPPGPHEGLLTLGLEGVSCASSTACAAVGTEALLARSATYNDNYEIMEFWNGKHWGLSREGRTNPQVGADLHGVSCVSTRACLAVGTEVERWNGSRWSNVPIPLTSAAFDQGSLYGVSCRLPTDCEIVGSISNSVFLVVPVAARWNP
jgi:hypothetical protein